MPHVVLGDGMSQRTVKHTQFPDLRRVEDRQETKAVTKLYST